MPFFPVMLQHHVICTLGPNGSDNPGSKNHHIAYGLTLRMPRGPSNHPMLRSNGHWCSHIFGHGKVPCSLGVSKRSSSPAKEKVDTHTHRNKTQTNIGLPFFHPQYLKGQHLQSTSIIHAYPCISMQCPQAASTVYNHATRNDTHPHLQL